MAEKEFGRNLTKKELKIIENKIGDCIDWYSAIELAIQNGIVRRNDKAKSIDREADKKKFRRVRKER